MHLQRRLAGKKLQRLQVLKAAKPAVSPARLKKALEGRKLTKVYREGKELRLAFDNGHILGLHMMLRGKLEWMEGEKPPAYGLLLLDFEGGQRLLLQDYQRKARIELDPEGSEVPDALSKAANTAFWKKLLQTKATIKNLLLDQQAVRGIGSAYADEILYQARISPFSVSNKIPPDKVKALATAVKKVLKNAIQHIRKAAPDIIGGELRDFLVVHNARKKKSPGGKAIKVRSTGGRKTYYTQEQQLYT